MERNSSFGLRVLAVLALAACCNLVAASLPPKPVCGSKGVLPDPTDCSYYMNCTENSDGSLTQTITPCPSGTYYDSCLGNCSITQQPENCSVPCTKTGTITSLSHNLAVYFLCVINETGTYLEARMCPDGRALDDKYSCNGDVVHCPVNDVPPETPLCNGTYYYGDDKNCSLFYYCSGQNVTADEGLCDSDQYFISYNHSCVEFQCTSQGRFADPVSCSGYYYCSRDGSGYAKTHYECPSGSHYDSSAGGCMLGDCTTVCPGGSGTFTCPSSGRFADPLSCSSYYFCDSNLEATHLECPNGSHFDSDVGGCMLGSCSSSIM